VLPEAGAGATASVRRPPRGPARPGRVPLEPGRASPTAAAGAGDPRVGRRPDLDPAVRGRCAAWTRATPSGWPATSSPPGTLVDEDPEAALAHARAARDRASRVAAVREAVGVAAYHAGDYAEAARELRAYRRMSGDQGYRAVLADCERALGRPEVALRLVAEALADAPTPRRPPSCGWSRPAPARPRRGRRGPAGARGALGGRPDPGSLTPGRPGRLRLASAYADLLRDPGRGGAGRRSGSPPSPRPTRRPHRRRRPGWVEFTEEDDDDGRRDHDRRRGGGRRAGARTALGGSGRRSGDDRSPRTTDGGRASFDEEVEAEVAELLGETDPPSSHAGRRRGRRPRTDPDIGASVVHTGRASTDAGGLGRAGPARSRLAA
jgi:hypothetical protein